MLLRGISNQSRTGRVLLLRITPHTFMNEQEIAEHIKLLQLAERAEAERRRAKILKSLHASPEASAAEKQEEINTEE